MAEGSETPNGEGTGSEGRARRGEGDLLAERRARRAAESGEMALTRRAEAAEATVQTLERHVSSLQQRLHEVEDERARTDQLIETERAAALEREHELRRVKQREYAEQQLRVEAEERLASLERESRTELERLDARLGVSEEDARELARRLAGVQRQLTDAEQEAAAQRAAAIAARHAHDEQGLHVRLVELERRALEIQRGLDAERAARERSEGELERMREGHGQLESLVGEMKSILARVAAALTAEGRTQGERASGRSPIERPSLARAGAGPSALEARGAEMADALAAAVERLRARAEVAAPAPTQSAASSSVQTPPQAPRMQAAPLDAVVATPKESPASESPPGPRVLGRVPDTQRTTHKHSMSWFARRRIKRKQRRGQ